MPAQRLELELEIFEGNTRIQNLTRYRVGTPDSHIDDVIIPLTYLPQNTPIPSGYTNLIDAFDGGTFAKLIGQGPYASPFASLNFTSQFIEATIHHIYSSFPYGSRRNQDGVMLASSRPSLKDPTFHQLTAFSLTDWKNHLSTLGQQTVPLLVEDPRPQYQGIRRVARLAIVPQP